MKTKLYESITFEVEKGLEATKLQFRRSSIEDIFSFTFQRAKIGSYDDNEPLEILHYNFDTEEKEFFNAEKKSLIQGLVEAYRCHYPMTITPDMIWLLFLQGYSRFMEKYHESVRSNYVNFENKKSITLTRLDMIPEKATKEDWEDIIKEFTQNIKNEVGENLISNLESNFSTTSPVSLTASQVSIMSSMKNYFTYELDFVGCGVSSVTLEGSLEDWQKIKYKLEFFSKKEMGLLWWIKHLMPIIDKIIKTKEYYNQNKDINEEIRNFWKDMVRVKFGDEYDPNLINGWIIKFIPNFSENEPKLYDELKDNDAPDQIICCPLELKVINKDKTLLYNCCLASGFYGMLQDEKTYNVKPVIGYSIVLEDKKLFL